MRGHGLNLTEDRMPMFMCLLNWTEQGIRSVKEAPKRAKAAQELAKKVGVEIKEVYLTSGDSDLLVILDTPNGDNVAKFALAISSQGNVRTRTARIWIARHSASEAARERASPGNPSALRKAFRAEDGCAHQRVHALV